MAKGFQKGHPQYFFKHSEATKLRLREINLGKKHTEETKKKLSLSHLGQVSSLKGIIFKPKPDCLDCGIKLKDHRSQRCYKCSKSGSLSPMFGKISPRKGVKLSFEQIEKHRKAMLGKKHTLEHRLKMSQIMKKRVEEGKHNFYIDGRSKDYIGSNSRKIIKNTMEYRIWREAVFARDNWTCTECGDKSKKGYFVYLEADHIKPWAFYPELRYAIDNGRTLCRACHRQTDTYGYKALHWKEAIKS